MFTDNKKHEGYGFLTAVQLAVILLPFAGFFDAALVFRGIINLSGRAAAAAFLLLNGGVLTCAVLAVLLYPNYRKSSLSDRADSSPFSRKKLISLLPIFLVVLLFVVLALRQFGYIQRYDSQLYYSSLITGTEKFRFTLKSLLHNFCLESHPTQGFAFLIAIGEMLFPRQSVGVYGVSLLLTIAAIFCLYGIMGMIFPRTSPWIKSAGAAVFAFCPYVLGLFSYTTPDYYLLMLFVIMIWCFARRLDYLAAFLSVLVCFSKETGILFAASFLLSAMFLRIREESGSGFREKAMRYLLPKRILIYGAAPILFVLYYKFSGNITFEEASTHHSPLIWDSTGFHCFGINLPNISARLSQALIYNLFWVITLWGLAAACIYLLKQKRLRRNSGSNMANQADASRRDAGESSGPDVAIAAGIIISSCAYLIFLCLFITNLCPRYSVCYALPLSLVSVLSITSIFKNKITSGLLISCIAALFLAQSYHNLDPVLTYASPKIFEGYQYIYSPTAVWYPDSFNMNYIGEMYVYNRTYSYADDLLDKALREMNLNENDSILYVEKDWFGFYLFGSIHKTDNAVYWDPVNQRRTYDGDTKGAFVPKSILCTTEGLLGGAKINLTNDFYFFLPAGASDTYIRAFEARGYSIWDSFIVKNDVGYITVYHMQHSLYTGILG